MALIERTVYPSFGPVPSPKELAEFYTPTSEEARFAEGSSRERDSMLGFLVMLKGFQRLGYFPSPEAVVSHVRSRLGLGPEAPAVPPPRSRACYREAIRGHLGVRAYGDRARRTATEAAAGAALTLDDPADLVNVAIEELAKERFELPAFSRLDRLARHVRHAVNARLFARVDGTLAPRGREMLDDLLEADRAGRSDLNVLKALPKGPTVKNLGELQQRLLWLESFGDTGTLDGLGYARGGRLRAPPSGASGHPDARRRGIRRRCLRGDSRRDGGRGTDDHWNERRRFPDLLRGRDRAGAGCEWLRPRPTGRHHRVATRPGHK